jgi:hypothetical protein
MAFTPPARDDIVGAGSNPSSGVARAGFGALWDWATSLLGLSGQPAEARNLLRIGSAISYRNLLVNATGAINQRLYVSGTATTVANQMTLDRKRVVVSGQSLVFGAAAPDRTLTAPAGGFDEIVEAGWIAGGVYTLSWEGTATATVNGAAITNGGQTAVLPANTAVTVRFIGGTVTRAQFELGTVATPFERRPPQAELALCMRECQKSYAIATALGANTASGAAMGSPAVGGVIQAAVRLAVPMRVAGAVRVWSGNGTAGVWAAYTTGGVAAAYAPGIAATDSSLLFSITVAAGESWATGHWITETGN